MPVLNIRPIRWTGRSLRVLDQRALPRREIYLECRTAADVAGAIRSMTLRGAPLIGCSAAFGMALAARRGGRKALSSAAKLLLDSRPTAVNLAHAVKRMLLEAEKSSTTELAVRLERAAKEYYEEDIAAGREMARFGASLIPKRARILTYCNAGALATAGVGTALGVIALAFRQGKVEHVFPCETRPYLQGSRLTLWELMRGGIPATLITDNMAAHLMKSTRIDAVVVGSDRIAANGDVCNKIGTYALAIAARHHRIPLIVAAPVSTIDMKAPDGDSIPIESRDPREVLEVAGIPMAPKGAAAHHFAFDVTPHSLVSAIVTELGIVRPPSGAGLRRLLAAPRGLRKRHGRAGHAGRGRKTKKDNHNDP